MRSARLPWLGLLLMVLAGAGARERVADRFRFYTQWSDDYLFFAALIEDLDVAGRHQDGNQPVWLDDDLELFLRTATPPGDKLDEQCFWLAMSAAQGFLFRRGSPIGEGSWLPSERELVVNRFRQATKVRGTLNDGSDADLGWQLEVALPWKALGRGAPKPGEVWAFNVVRHLRGEADARYSHRRTALPVTAQAEPKRWGKIVFRGEKGGEDAWLEAGDEHAVICARAPEPRRPAVGLATGRPVAQPLIDGELADGEWPDLYRIDEQLRLTELLPLPHEDYPMPVAPQRPPPGCELPERNPEPRAERTGWTGERLILAPYLLAWHDDPRSPVAPFGVRRADGSCRLAAVPIGGLGPWFSGLRTGWHEEQLTAAAEARLDGLLVTFAGDRASQERYSRAAVWSLVQAARELHAQRRTVPGLGLLVPLSALRAEVGEGLDLTQRVAQESFYRMIRDFYRLVPPELRLQVADGARQSCLVGLDQPPRDVRGTADFLAYAEARFREESGLDLLWVGSLTWSRRRLPVDSGISLDAGLEPVTWTGARIKTASVGPGCDDSAAPVPEVRERNGAATLREDLKSALAASPDWLFVSSWNDFLRGTQVAASRATGNAAEHALKIASLAFDSPGESPWIAKLRRAEVPARMASGEVVDCPVTVANGGIRPWEFGDQVRLGYRWYTAVPEPVLQPDGTPLKDKQDRPVTRLRALTEAGLRSEVLALGSQPEMATVLPVAARLDDGRPLPPGRYRLRLDAVAGSSEKDVPLLDDQGREVRDEKGKPKTRRETVVNWFSLRKDPTVDLFVEIIDPAGRPARAATILSSGLPARLETGRTYPLRLRLRNDGGEPWDAGVGLAARFEVLTAAEPCKVEPAPLAATGWMPLGSVLETLRAELIRAAERTGAPVESLKLPAAIEPGQVVELPVALPCAADGRPLAPDPGPGRVYRVVLAVTERDGRPLPSTRPYGQVVQLLAHDWGGSFGRLRVPVVMQAGDDSTCGVEVVNTGWRTWPAGSVQVSWSWYTWDGVEAAFDAGRAPLPAEVEPAGRAAVEVPVRAPAGPGPYLLLFDLVHPGHVRNGAQASTTGRELVPRPVVVVGGEMVPVDLQPVCNVVGTHLAGSPVAGDFDGHGRSFPAELLPPGTDDTAVGLYPAGYLGPTGADVSSREVVFRLLPARRRLTMVKPDGQPLPVPPGRYRRLHLLAAAVGADLTARFEVLPGGAGRDRQPVALAPVAVSAWTGPPRHGERFGLSAAWRRGPAEPELGAPAYLHHVIVSLDPEQSISAVILPQDSELRIAAITLEKAGPARVGPPVP